MVPSVCRNPDEVPPGIIQIRGCGPSISGSHGPAEAPTMFDCPAKLMTWNLRAASACSRTDTLSITAAKLPVIWMSKVARFAVAVTGALSQPFCAEPPVALLPPPCSFIDRLPPLPDTRRHITSKVCPAAAGSSSVARASRRAVLAGMVSTPPATLMSPPGLFGKLQPVAVPKVPAAAVT